MNSTESKMYDLSDYVRRLQPSDLDCTPEELDQLVKDGLRGWISDVDYLSMEIVKLRARKHPGYV